MSVRAHRRRRWPLVTAACLVFVLVLAVMVYQNPFWLIDRGVHVYLKTHGVKDGSVDVGGNRIHYLEAGPVADSNNRTVLLIHGLGARATDWAPLIPPLAAHGYHVYAIDLLGYGESAKPKNGDVSLPGEEQVVSGFMRALSLKQADVAGWSMGGWIAMLMALDHPDQVSRLLLFDSAGLYFNPDFDASLFNPTDRAGLQRLVARIEPDKPNIRIPAWAVHGMLRRFQANRSIIQQSFRSMVSGRYVVDFRLSRLQLPVLIVWGTEDKLTPFDQAERLHALMPQSELFGLPGCGHLAAAECAKAVAPLVLRFLDAPQSHARLPVAERSPAE